ncbi:MAG: ergothioneine biosynthesis protein EgtB [Bdellovibrionales bacterium]
MWNQISRVRKDTVKLCEALINEEFVIQTAPFVSPPKWHLGHTTWFFEEFFLKTHSPDYQEFHPAFAKLLNSYYHTVGEFWPQGQRGLLARPSVAEIMDYRAYVEDRLHTWLNQNPVSSRVREILSLGCNHEQQHQELLWMDTKYNAFQNPLCRENWKPAEVPSPKRFEGGSAPIEFIHFDPGSVSIGNDGDPHFSYDNEGPRHVRHVKPFALADRLVSNGEYLEFIESCAYINHEHWLSDGYLLVQKGLQGAPLYWFQRENQWYEFDGTFSAPLDLSAPVQHVSFYEAAAYAFWRGHRLPYEEEWESVAESPRLKDMNEKLWQWTLSPYQPYPGYRRPKGAFGEYNQKFMINQVVLRGGCFRTPEGHHRVTYRNFFYPDQKWMFSGIRLAKDLT